MIALCIYVQLINGLYYILCLHEYLGTTYGIWLEYLGTTYGIQDEYLDTTYGTVLEVPYSYTWGYYYYYCYILCLHEYLGTTYGTVQGCR